MESVLCVLCMLWSAVVFTMGDIEMKERSVIKEKGSSKRVKFEQGELNHLKALILGNPQIEKRNMTKLMKS